MVGICRLAEPLFFLSVCVRRLRGRWDGGGASTEREKSRCTAMPDRERIVHSSVCENLSPPEAAAAANLLSTSVGSGMGRPSDGAGGGGVGAIECVRNLRVEEEARCGIVARPSATALTKGMAIQVENGRAAWLKLVELPMRVT